MLQAEERDKVLEERRLKERVNSPLDPVLDQLTQVQGGRGVSDINTCMGRWVTLG